MLESPTVSSASILLAIITALYGLFYPSIKEIIDADIKSHPNEKDNKPLYNKAKDVYHSKVKPLVAGATLTIIIFIPEFYNNLSISLHNLIEYGYAGTTYDFTITVFSAVTIFTAFQTWNIWNAAIKLRKKVNSVRKVLEGIEK